MKSLIHIRFNRYIVLAIAIGLAIMYWPRTCTKVQSQGSTVMQENVYFRGVRGCPSTAEINNPAWYDTPLFDLKL